MFYVGVLQLSWNKDIISFAAEVPRKKKEDAEDWSRCLVGKQKPTQQWDQIQAPIIEKIKLLLKKLFIVEFYVQNYLLQNLLIVTVIICFTCINTVKQKKYDGDIMAQMMTENEATVYHYCTYHLSSFPTTQWSQ